MRIILVLSTMLLPFFAGAPAWSQTQELPACPSREKAQMAMQSGGATTLPEGCRRVAIRRLDTPAGPVCAIEFGQEEGGVIGTVRDAMTTTTWWTACANFRAP